MYEDRVTGKITERNFSMLSDKYQTEQETLAQTILSILATMIIAIGILVLLIHPISERPATICTLYQITERNFSMLSDKYQTEQETLAQTIDSLQQQLAKETQESADAEKWIALIKQYTAPTELTAELLNALIEKILVHEASKDENGNRVQKVEQN